MEAHMDKRRNTSVWMDREMNVVNASKLRETNPGETILTANKIIFFLANR